jgi:hypothetical protein
MRVQGGQPGEGLVRQVGAAADIVGDVAGLEEAAHVLLAVATSQCPPLVISRYADQIFLALEPLHDLLAERLHVDQVSGTEDWIAAHPVEAAEGGVHGLQIAVDVRQHADELDKPDPLGGGRIVRVP